MSRQCGHEKCHCTVYGGDEYCSDYCEDRSEAPEVDVLGWPGCRCGHAACAE
jgi:hypothetical protein